MHPRRVSLAVTGLLILFALSSFSGCASQYAARTEQYQEAISQTSVVHLINDAIFFCDVEGGKHVVHVEKSERMLAWITNAVPRIVSEKGYVVSDWSVSSVGLSAKPGSAFKVYLGSEHSFPDWFSAENLEQRPIPIAFHARDCNDYCAENISKLHWGLFNLRDLRGRGRMNANSALHFSKLKTSVKAATKELDLSPDSVLLVTQSVTVKIPEGKKVAEYLGSAALLFGGIPVQPMWESDTTMHVLSVVNPAGDVLWTHVVGPWAGGFKQKEDAENFLESLFQYLPDHPNEPSVSDSGR